MPPSCWRLATDPKNEGRDAKWFAAPRKNAKPTKVPWNTLLIRENLGTNPIAERLLRNLLNYAADPSKQESVTP